MRGRLRRRRYRPVFTQRRKPLRHAAHFLFGLPVVAAQLLLEGDRFEAFDALGERRLLVEVPEEAGVFEAGAENAGVAVADDGAAFVVDLGVEHGQEVRGELAVRVFDREVLLVVAHHGDQHFFRQGEVLGLEVAEDDGGPLGEVDDGLDQRLVFAPAGAGDGAGGGVQGLCE